MKSDSRGSTDYSGRMKQRKGVERQYELWHLHSDVDMVDDGGVDSDIVVPD